MARSTEDKLQQFPLAAGMNQAGGTRGSAPGSLEYVINGRIKATGRIERRCGTAGLAALSKGGGGARAYADSSAIPRPTERPVFAATLNGQSLKGTTAGDLYSYGGTFDEFCGCFSAARPVRRRVAMATGETTALVGYVSPVAVTSTGYRLVAALASSELFWTVEDPNGRVLYRGEGISVGTLPYVRVVAQGTKLILLYRSGATTITGISHETSTGVITTSTATVLTVAGGLVRWDATPYDASSWYIIGRTSAGTVTVQTMANLTAGTTGTISVTGEPIMSIWGDATNGRLWVGYIDDPSGTPVAGFTTLTTAFTVVYAKTDILTGADIAATDQPPLFGPRYARGSSDAFFVCAANGSSGDGVFRTRYGHVVGGVVTPSTPAVVQHVSPVSKPDLQQRFWVFPDPVSSAGNSQFLLLRYGETPSSTANVLVVEVSTPVGLALWTTSPVPTWHAVAVTDEAAGGSAFFALPTVLNAATSDGSGGQAETIAVHLYEYERWNQAPTLDVDAGNELLIAGAPTSAAGLGTTSGTQDFAGIGAVELGFGITPQIFSSQATPSGVGVAAGSYQYVAIFQWSDALGRRHLSAPSAPLSVTLTETSSVALEVSDYKIGQRLVGGDQRVAVLLYRTVDGGQIPQLLPVSKPSTSSDGTVAFTDTYTDAVVSQNEFLPTAGGILSNRLGPACRYIRSAEDRVWLGGLWDRSILEASRVLIPSEPPCFTQDASHQVVIPGDCNGLAYQDGQIVAFCADGIYLVGGDGPNDQGAGTFLPPRAYVRGLGCTEADAPSILETELGIIFRSPSTWWLIPRGFGSPVDIGAAIQDERSHCIAATVTETSAYRLARFLVGTSGSYASDTVLTFDLTTQQWFRDVYSGGEFGVIGPWPNGLALLQYSLERTGAGAVANVVWSESESLLSDAAGTTTYIPLSLRTNWIYPFGPAGWGKVNRIQLAGEPLDAGAAVVRDDDITITVETDQNSYGPSWTNTANSSSGPVYREVVLKVPRCTCYRVTVLVTQSSGTATEALRLLSLTAELEPDGGIRPLLEAERL